MTPEEIISVARSLVGVPFRHQGRDPAIGLDCIGTISCVATRLGIPHEDRRDYPETPGSGQLEKALDEQEALERVYVLEPGCIVAMRISRALQHVGVYTGSTLIHAWKNAGKVCEHDFDALWRSRVMRIYRLKVPS